MSLRDPEFLQSLENFLTTSTLYTEKQLPEKQVSHGISANPFYLTVL